MSKKSTKAKRAQFLEEEHQIANFINFVKNSPHKGNPPESVLLPKNLFRKKKKKKGRFPTAKHT